MTRTTDDLGLVTWLEETHGYEIVTVERGNLGRQIYTVSRDITPELVDAYTASAWKQARERYHPPGHTM